MALHEIPCCLSSRFDLLRLLRDLVPCGRVLLRRNGLEYVEGLSHLTNAVVDVVLQEIYHEPYTWPTESYRQYGKIRKTSDGFAKIWF